MVFDGDKAMALGGYGGSVVGGIDGLVASRRRWALMSNIANLASSGGNVGSLRPPTAALSLNGASTCPIISGVFALTSSEIFRLAICVNRKSSCGRDLVS